MILEVPKSHLKFSLPFVPLCQRTLIPRLIFQARVLLFVLYVHLSCHAVGNEPLLIFLQIVYL